MKKFKDFIVSEEVDLTAGVESGKVDVHDHAVRNNINAFLNGEVGCNVVTPYVALNKVNKVLANFHIFLPKAPYMEDNQGAHVFRLHQFGKVAGMRNDGSVVTKVENPYSLYFEWKRNERGMFDVFAEIVTDEELDNLLKAVEDDISDDDSRSEKLDESTKKKIKTAYQLASNNPEDPEIEKQLKAAAKSEKKKLDQGKKLEETSKEKAAKYLKDKAIGLNPEHEGKSLANLKQAGKTAPKDRGHTLLGYQYTSGGPSNKDIQRNVKNRQKGIERASKILGDKSIPGLAKKYASISVKANKLEPNLKSGSEGEKRNIQRFKDAETLGRHINKKIGQLTKEEATQTTASKTDAIGGMIKNMQDRESMDKLVDKKAIRPFAPVKAYPGEGSDSGKPFVVRNKLEEALQEAAAVLKKKT